MSDMAPGKRKNWNTEDMKKAITAVRSNTCGYLKAAKLHNVPKSTLIRLVLKEDSEIEEVVNTKLGRKPVFPEHFEKMLVDYVLTMESKLFGLSRMDVKYLAYQLAEKNNIMHPFSKENQLAGKDWLRGFLKRNPNLAFRSPTGTSLARARGFTKDNVNTFFDILEKEMDNFIYSANNVFNVDETGISVVPSKLPQVLSRKGKRQIGSLTSAERGSTITTIVCMSASGIFVPPLFIFPRKKRSDLLLKGAPPGSIYECHPSGWVQTYIFTIWFKHFITHVKPSAASPILLVLDGHSSHTRNIEILDLARENHVSMVSIPPHSSHKIQPLDKTFMGPLKRYLSEEIRVWMRSNCRALTHFDMTDLYGKAYMRVQSGEIAINGFRTTGIFPLNRHIFRDDEFLAADEEEPHSPPRNCESACEAPEEILNNESTVESETASRVITPMEISPVPIKKTKRSNRGRPAGKSTLLTSSPYKKSLQISLEKAAESKPLRETKKRQDSHSNKPSTSKKNIKKFNFAKEKFAESSTSKSVMKTMNSAREKCPGKRKKTNSSSSSDLDDSYSVRDESDEFLEFANAAEKEDAKCLYCSTFYSEDRPGEIWVQCVSCNNWSHEECAGCEQDLFICDMCTQ
ncbi:uncharacterized protein [Eurosta solidaginis]|uniref:uncharacterized protein n=1 Tax=Eurosta solidaginis TaxID=178769 RepID=UPI0035312F55